MFARSTRYAMMTALLCTVSLAACDDGNSATGVSSQQNTATVRFVNATGTALDFASGGTVGTGNGNLTYGSSSSCNSVDVSNTGSLSVRTAGSTTTVAGFAPTLGAGGNYTIIAYPGAGGAMQFATLATNGFSPATGASGFRAFNAAGSGNYDVYVTAPGAALGTATAAGVGSGSSSAFVSTAAGISQIRLTSAGSQSTLLDVGNQTFTAGQNRMLVIAPAVAGTTPRAFFVTGC